ncbi:MAG: amino acid ABC transporter permease [Acidimicrobiales bacterium]
MNLLSLWGQYIVPFLHGLAVTVELTVLGLVVAIVLGALVAACRLSRLRLLRWLGAVYVDILRSVPVLVLLFIAYYGLGQVGLKLSGVEAGTAALGVFYAALFAEIFRGGFQSVQQGQHEAAQALGLGAWLRLWKVVAPQAFLAVVLPSTNEFSNIIKDTSLVVTIGVADLMSKAYEASANTFQPMDMFVLAGLIYLCLYLVVARGLGRWEANVQRRRS